MKAKTAPTFARVRRVVGGRFAAEIEDGVYAHFKNSGGSSKRWAARDWRAMADAISRAEDRIELAHPRADRSVLRKVRRDLEDAAG